MTLSTKLYQARVTAGAVTGIAALMPRPAPMLASFFVNSHCNKREFFGRDAWPRERELLDAALARRVVGECAALGVRSYRFPIHPGQFDVFLDAIEAVPPGDRLVLVTTASAVIANAERINASRVTHVVAGLPVLDPAGAAVDQLALLDPLTAIVKPLKAATYLMQVNGETIEPLILDTRRRGFGFDLHVADARKHLVDLEAADRAWFSAMLPPADLVRRAYRAMRRHGILPGRTGQAALRYLTTTEVDFAHCVQAFFELEIWTDASVRLCHGFPAAGDLRTQPLRAIVESAGYRETVDRAYALDCMTCAAACQVSSLVNKPWRLSPSYLRRRLG